MQDIRGNITFLPGHEMAPHEYHRTLQTLRATGFSVHGISLPWKSSFQSLVTFAEQEVANAPGDEPILFGHSYGANLLLDVAKTRPIGGLILSSVSTLCANGLAFPQGREVVESNFPSQQEAIRQYEIGALVSDLDHLHRSQVAVLVGGAEAKKFPYMKELAHTTAEAFGVDVTVVPNAPHFIEYSEPYIRAISVAALGIQAANQAR